jgi:hypothetical protein
VVIPIRIGECTCTSDTDETVIAPFIIIRCLGLSNGFNSEFLFMWISLDGT